jgi:hypothetical protein
MYNDSLKEILAKIAETKRLGETLREKKSITSPDDMYTYEIRKPDLESKHYKVFHGKCLKEASTTYIDRGYQLNPIQHFPLKNDTFAGVRCEYCKEYLNKKLNDSKRLANLEKVQRIQRSYEKWVQRQILLGKM